MSADPTQRTAKRYARASMRQSSSSPLPLPLPLRQAAERGLNILSKDTVIRGNVITAENPDQHELDELRDVFAMFDKDGSGKVTTSKLGKVLEAFQKKVSNHDLKRIIINFDVNGDGEIDFAEFVQLMHERNKIDVDQLKSAFDVFDSDGDSSISAKEIEHIFKAMGEKLDRETIDLMIESVDSDGNGFIDFEEFKQMMLDGPVRV